MCPIPLACHFIFSFLSSYMFLLVLLEFARVAPKFELVAEKILYYMLVDLFGRWIGVPGQIKN